MLNVENLHIEGLLEPLSFTLAPGERLGIIGESGSGKTLTALSIMGLLPKGLRAQGSITLDGQELVGLPERQLRRLRGKKVAMVFQEPMNALDPLMRVGRQLSFAGAGPEALADVGLDPELARRFPHELSGGQRQRVLIAMAMAGQPDVLICDEPTTALDATTQHSILTLIEKLVASLGTALLFISHNLRVIQRMCPEVLVLRRGQVVEHGATADILHHPQHEYTHKLVAASLPGDAAPERPTSGTALALRGVTKRYGSTAAVENVTLHVAHGERLGIVGGSGSGKTTLLKLITGLTTPTDGEVTVDGRVQVVFQDPQGSLNPRLPVWKSVAEGLGSFDRAAVDAALAKVGIDPATADRYPHEFSGGQRQRISIARALIGKPDILLADEAVSALDVSVRAQVLDLLASLVDEYGLTLVFISHDLDVVRQVCSTIAVIHRGRIMEHGPADEIWTNPQHEYTQDLLRASRG